MKTVERLEMFLTLCECGSFTLAAKKLYRSQPTISHHMQQLEEQFGAALIKRQNHEIQLTEQGKIVHRYATNILQLIRELEYKVQQSLLVQHRILPVYVSNYISEYFLTDILDGHNRSDPEHLLEIHSYCYNDLRRFLLEGQTRFALMPIYPNDTQLLQQFDTIALFEETLVLVVAPSHPFSHRKLIYPRDLNKQYVLVPQSDYLCELIQSKLQRLRSHNRYLQMSNFGNIKKSVMAGHGIAFLPQKTVSHELSEGKLITIKVAGLSLFRQNGILIKRGAELEEREFRLIQQVRQYFKQKSPPLPLDCGV